MKTLKHFIWDFDGTLMDTYKNITRYLRLALLDFGKEVSDTEIMQKMMTSIRFAIEYYSEFYDLEELGERYLYYSANELNDEVHTLPYVKEVLAKIKQNGGKNYIFTHRNNSIFFLLEKCGIKDEFVEVITSESEQFALKPSPDAIYYLMEKYGTKKEDTVMIGDRACDLGSGYNAGCKTIHLLTPMVPEYPPCDFRIESFKEMLEALD